MNEPPGPRGGPGGREVRRVSGAETTEPPDGSRRWDDPRGPPGGRQGVGDGTVPGVAVGPGIDVGWMGAKVEKAPPPAG